MVQEAARTLKGKLLETLKASSMSHAEAQQLRAQLSATVTQLEVCRASWPPCHCWVPSC